MFLAAVSRSAFQFRRPLANEVKGYEDKDGVIHLETSAEDEVDEEVENFGGLISDNKQIKMREFGENIPYLTREALKICEPRFINPLTEHPLLRAATSEHGEAPGNTSRSYLGGEIAIKSTKLRAKKNYRASNRDPTFEPEEYNDPFDQMSPNGHKKPAQHRHGRRFARKKPTDYKAPASADDGKPISTRTRRGTVARLSNKKQYSRLRTSLPTYKRSPRKRVNGIFSLCQIINLMIKLTSKTQKLLLLHPLPVKRFEVQSPPPRLPIAAHY